MASQLGFSDFMSNNENIEKQSHKRKNRTIKKKNKPK